MEKLITIRPIEISEVKVSTASPITKRRSMVKKDTIKKFMNFNSVKKGAIAEEELLSIKPELDVNGLSQYEENLSLDRLLAKLNKVNSVLRKYGYINLCISPENVKKLINEIPSVEEELANNSDSKEADNTVSIDIPEDEVSNIDDSNPFSLPQENEEIALEEVPSFDDVTSELEEIPRKIA